MSYVTRYYTCKGSDRLVDELVHLAISNDCRVSNRTSTGIFKKEHSFHVFGPVDNLNRFESQMADIKRSVR